jgi:hypothetical protein
MHQLVRSRIVVRNGVAIVAEVVEMTVVLAAKLVLSVCVQNMIRRLSVSVE